MYFEIGRYRQNNKQHWEMDSNHNFQQSFDNKFGYTEKE